MSLRSRALNPTASKNRLASFMVFKRGAFFPISINQGANVISIFGGLSFGILGPLSVFPYATVIWAIPPILFLTTAYFRMSYTTYNVIFWGFLIWQVAYAVLWIIGCVGDVISSIVCGEGVFLIAITILLAILNLVLWFLYWRVFYVVFEIRKIWKQLGIKSIGQDFAVSYDEISRIDPLISNKIGYSVKPVTTQPLDLNPKEFHDVNIETDSD